MSTLYSDLFLVSSFMSIPLPIFIITGYLGAGKTSLLQTILQQSSDKHYAVIVNEFSALSVDKALLQQQSHTIIELSNGCLCCSVEYELLQTIEKLAQTDKNLDGILIETTGLAKLSNLLHTFLINTAVRAKFAVQRVITLVDAKYSLVQLEQSNIALDQLAYANTIIINKTDLITESKQIILRQKLQQINPNADIIASTYANIDWSLLISATDMILLPKIISQHHSQTEIQTIGLSRLVPLDLFKFTVWLQNFVATQGHQLLRCKGLLYFKDKPQCFVLQGVYRNIYGDFQAINSQDRQSCLVLIGRNLNIPALQQAFSN